jgi:hypothetical protein
MLAAFHDAGIGMAFKAHDKRADIFLLASANQSLRQAPAACNDPYSPDG